MSSATAIITSMALPARAPAAPSNWLSSPRNPASMRMLAATSALRFAAACLICHHCPRQALPAALIRTGGSCSPWQAADPPERHVEKPMQTEKQKMLAGELYHAGDAELAKDRNAASAWMV